MRPRKVILKELSLGYVKKGLVSIRVWNKVAYRLKMKF